RFRFAERFLPPRPPDSRRARSPPRCLDRRWTAVLRWPARTRRSAQSLRMDARLLGVAIPHASVGSFVRRSHAPFAITAPLCRRLELTVYYFDILHRYLSVVITLSHLTNR